MKKNKKGFTLIELLAVVVIMGILAIIVVPKIMDLVLQSREEIYLQDTRKFLSQAQYKMNSNSTEIEKPEIGESIVFSLKYLTINDFRTPPNDGTYLNESSFVVVKNVDGNFEYAVTLIEHRKDGLFQGVEFVTEKQLFAQDAIKHVRYFNDNELRYIDQTASDSSKMMAGNQFLDESYINSQLSRSGVGSTSWIPDNSIVTTYNVNAMKEGIISNASIPSIDAKIASTSGSSVEKMNATLTVVATDSDDSLDTLIVCTRVSSNESSGSMDDALYPTYDTNPELCEKYGDRKFYTKQFNFEEYGFNYIDRTKVFIYLTVMDPGGSIVRKNLFYNIHTNEGPQINQMIISKRSGDTVNLPFALLKVNVKDDVDDTRNLQVCFHQDITGVSECNGTYKPYSSYFDTSNSYIYQFTDGDGNKITKPDGTSHSLTMFVKDSDGKVNIQTVDYDIYNNQVPKIVSSRITPDHIGDYNSLSYNLSLVITDDLDDKSHLFVKVDDNDPVTYQDFLRSNRKYTASGLFDGQNRQIEVRVWDQFMDEEDAEVVTLTLENVYQNSPPVIQNIKLTNPDPICIVDEKCLASSKDLNSYRTEITFEIEDDVVTPYEYDDKIMLCVSENASDCTQDKIQNFKKFSDYQKKVFTFEVPTGSRKYEAEDNRNLYFGIIEKENSGDLSQIYYSSYGPVSYSIYQNKGPELLEGSTFSVTSSDARKGYNVSKVILNLSSFHMSDDFNDFQLQFCYTVDGGSPICTDPLFYDKFLSTYKGASFTFRDSSGNAIKKYNGQEIDTYIIANDSYGLSFESDHFLYTLFKDGAPSIMSVELHPYESGYNSNYMYATFKVLDVGDTYTVCFKENGPCNSSDFISNPSGGDFSGDYIGGDDPREYSLPYDGERTGHWSSQYDEENPEKTFVFAVKDSAGNVVNYQNTLKYTVYQSCLIENANINSSSLSVHEGFQPISASYCDGACYHSFPSNNTNGSIKNNISTKYDNSISYHDKFVSISCPDAVQEEIKYCDYHPCFIPEGSTHPNYIGLKINDTSYVWTDSPAGEVMDVPMEKPYCDELIANNSLLFTSKDPRCTNKSFCDTYARNMCTDSDNEAMCINIEKSECKASLNNFCSRGLDQGLEAIECSSMDESKPEEYEVHFCNTDFINGLCIDDPDYCYSYDSTCTQTQIQNGTCPKVLSSGSCHKVCYRKQNCADETKEVQAVVTCHGYLNMYSGIYLDNKMFLAKQDIKICPEVITKYPNHYRYDPSTGNYYIRFNEDEQSTATGINVTD